MLDNQDKINIPATAAKGLVCQCINFVCDATDVLDNNNIAPALESQIKINVAMRGMIRKRSVEPIVLA